MAGQLLFHGWDLAAPGLTDRSGRPKAPDFLQFYTYGALAGSGQRARLYVSEAHAGLARQRVQPPIELKDFRPNYPPVIAWLFVPLASLPYQHAMAAFSLLSIGAYALAVWLLVRACGGRREGVHDRPMPVTLAAAAFPAIFAVLRYGQLSALSLLLVSGAIAAVAARRDLLTGVLLGLLAYKPNLLIVPTLVFAWTRQWRLLVGLALGSGTEMAANLALAGTAPMRQYLDVLVAIARQPEVVQFFPAESHSLRGFVRLLLPWPLLAAPVGLLAIPAACWLATRAWRAHTDWRPRWAALLLAACLASPHLLTYDTLLLAVSLVLTLDWHLTARGRVPHGEWRWGLWLLYFAAWPGTFIARLYHVQPSTIGMVLVLWLLSRALPSPKPELAHRSPTTISH